MTVGVEGEVSVTPEGGAEGGLSGPSRRPPVQLLAVLGPLHMATTNTERAERYWLKINEQARVSFRHPLNPGFVFWLRRRFRAKVVSEGGERVTLTTPEPLSSSDLEDLYWELEYRQHLVRPPSL